MSAALTSSSPPVPPWGDDGAGFWPITVDLYRRMIQAGVLGKSDRVFLWRGRLAPRMTVNRPHSASVTKTSNRLYDLRLPGYFVESEQPMAFRLAPSAPQPDVKVVRGAIDDYPIEFPRTSDVALVIEVADSSLATDRALAADYASEEIPHYWIVNIPGRRLEAFSEPTAGFYASTASFGPADEVPVILDGREVGRLRVADLLP